MQTVPPRSLPAGAVRLPARFAWLRFIDREGPARKLLALEPSNGGFRRGAVGHLDEAKAFGAAGVAIGNHMDRVHGTILLKELAQVMIGGAECKIAYKDIHATVLFIVKSGETVARSSEQYAEANDARAKCRRDGENNAGIRKHILLSSVVGGTIAEKSIPRYVFIAVRQYA